MAPLVVGFDLDMTLVDSRVGVHATLRALIDETGAPIDADVVVARLGPPLEQELATWVPAEQIDPLADRFRELYVDLGLVGLVALPGAGAALDAVRAVSGRTLVVTAKYEPNAWRCLKHAGLDVDHVVGWRHGPQKGETLAQHGASVYVGDTPPDMDAAHLAGAIAVAVPTGPFTADDLAAAGADVVLDSLEEFPDWFKRRGGGTAARRRPG
jgi:phosphoglycolate phosphatase-like HAD superfamily hydrolase